MYYTMFSKSYAYHIWDYYEDQLTGISTKMTQVEYWSAWSILHDAYILDMDDVMLWVELERPNTGDICTCWIMDELRDWFRCPYNKVIKAYEPPKIGDSGLYEWHNRWSETHKDWLREVQKNFNYKENFTLSQAQWDRVRRGHIEENT